MTNREEKIANFELALSRAGFDSRGCEDKGTHFVQKLAGEQEAAQFEKIAGVFSRLAPQTGATGAAIVFPFGEIEKITEKLLRSHARKG
jgi:hypothetical protein